MTELINTVDADIWASAAEQHARTATVANTANRILASIFQRDGMSETRRSQQSLDVYAADGTPANPAVGEFGKQFAEQVHTLVRNTSHELSPEEWGYMTMVVPELVRALVLDERHVDRIYRDDLLTVVETAVDWFKNPAAIQHTHIRVGYGGETQVGNRAPVYIKPALETMERVREVFARHRNWSMFRALREQLGTDNGPAMDEYIANRFKPLVASRNGARDLESLSVGEILQELNTYEHTTPAELQPILASAWQYFGKELDYEALGRRFHFTDRTPTLVVFNGTEAAIHINGKDAASARASRDQTQRLLHAYVAEFHPQLAEAVVFQNDVPWEEHTYTTELVIMYLRDLIYKANGGLDEVNRRLAQFAHHHAEGAANGVYGMPGHIAYAALHPLFFQDRLRVNDNAERLPEVRVMEDIPTPRNVLYFQGPPEIVFGEYRKLVASQANRSDFIGWLEQRYNAGVVDKVALARTVWERAQILLSQPTKGGKARTLQGSLFEASRTMFEQLKRAEQEAGVPEALTYARKQLEAFLSSERFAQAEDQEAVFRRFLNMLETERPTERPEMIRAVIDEVRQEQEDYYTRMFEITKAWGARDGSLQQLLRDPRNVAALYPWKSAELTLRVGEIPAYYILEGVDGSLWPDFAPATLSRYREILEAAQQQELRLKQISGYGEKLAKTALGMNGNKETGVFPVSDAIMTDWIGQDSEAVAQIYRTVDRMLLNGSDDRDAANAGAERFAELAMATILDQRTAAFIRETGTDMETARRYVRMMIVPVLGEAKKTVLGEVAVRVFQTTAVLRDYQLLLADIDDDAEMAEQTYHRLAERVLYDSAAV